MGSRPCSFPLVWVVGYTGDRLNRERVERHHGGSPLRYEGHFQSWMINDHKTLASWRARRLQISQRGQPLPKRGRTAVT